MFRKKKSEPKENPLQDKLAGKIAGCFTWLQEKFSNAMNKRFASMNLKNVKIALLLFCFCSGGLSIYFFIDAIVSKPTIIFKVDPVRMPKHFDRMGDEVMENEMPADIYQQIQAYKKYMESKGETIGPGLLDSIHLLEQIYLQQQK